MKPLQRRKLWILIMAALFLPAAGAWAQTAGGAAASGATKIGILNVRQAIVTTAEGKQASAQLQSQFAAQQTDLQNVQK
jgi:Skp family chaperone for outer membrane proteins